MRQHPDHPDHGAPHHGADGAPLAGLDTLTDAFHDTLADLLRQTIEALRWGGTGHVAGCTVGDYLTFECGLPRWLAGQLESVARRLDAVPHVAGLFWDSVLSFDQLASFVRATARFNGELLARLDEEAASLADKLAVERRLHGWVQDVGFLVEELKAPGWRSRQERRLERGRRTIAQQDFDGGGFIGSFLDPVGWATRMASLDAETDPDEVARLGVQRARAEAEIRIAQAHLDGDPGTGRPARPTMVWHIDIAHATADRFAQMVRLTGAGRAMAPISARLAATLGEQADHIIQLRDGRRPLDELAVAADDIPARVRRAVLGRDRGCRFPDCGRPRTHVHHIVPRARGGTHAPDNLLALCSFHHLRYVHRLGWSVHLDPISGLATWTNTRTGTEVGTMPIGARPPPRRDPSLLPDWAAPPAAPPPVEQDPPGTDLYLTNNPN